MTRSKRIKITQLCLLLLGLLLIILTYFQGDNDSSKKEILSKNLEERITKELEDKKLDESKTNTFFNIEYSGLDFSGNRYKIQSEEATTTSTNSTIVNMKGVKALFYLKDDTILEIWSDYGVYNNLTLDMQFNTNVEANYVDDKLFADKAEYSSSLSTLTVADNVKAITSQGKLTADKLLFDVETQTLNIDSFNDNKINANIIK